MKERVVFLTGSLRMGGTERNILHLATGLSRERYDVEVWSDYEGEELQAELRAKGITCHALKQAPSLGKPFLTRLFSHNLPFQRRLFRWLRANRDAIVHVFGFPMAYYGVLLGRLAGCKRIVFSVQDWDVWKRTCIYRTLDRICSRLARRIVADGQGARRLAVKEQGMDAGRFVTIYDGVDVSELQPTRPLAETKRSLGLTPDRVTVGMIARLDVAKKAQDVFLRALPMIADQSPGVQFLIVGDGPDRAQVEALAGELPADSRPALPGSRADLADVILATDVLVIPSRWESVPKILLEAMWLERPIVATRVGDIPEILDERCGRLTPADDAKAIADAVVELLSDKEGRAQLGRAARARILQEGLTLEASIRAYERLYAEL